jgi:hypothetical protein
MGKIHKVHRILLAAAGGIIILMAAWPGRLPFDSAGSALASAVQILFAVLGALLISYALHEIHQALVPLGWSAFFLGNVVTFLAGNSDGMMADLAIVIMAGVPGAVLLIIGIRMFLQNKRRVVS